MREPKRKLKWSLLIGLFNYLFICLSQISATAWGWTDFPPHGDCKALCNSQTLFLFLHLHWNIYICYSNVCTSGPALTTSSNTLLAPLLPYHKLLQLTRHLSTDNHQYMLKKTSNSINSLIYGYMYSLLKFMFGIRFLSSFPIAVWSISPAVGDASLLRWFRLAVNWVSVTMLFLFLLLFL